MKFRRRHEHHRSPRTNFGRCQSRLRHSDQEEAGQVQFRTALHPRQHRAHHTLKVDHHALAHTHHLLLSTGLHDLSPSRSSRKRSTPYTSPWRPSATPLSSARDTRSTRHRNAERGGPHVRHTCSTHIHTINTEKKERTNVAAAAAAAVVVVATAGRAAPNTVSHTASATPSIRPTPLVEFIHSTCTWSSRASRGGCPRRRWTSRRRRAA